MKKAALFTEVLDHVMRVTRLKQRDIANKLRIDPGRISQIKAAEERGEEAPPHLLRSLIEAFEEFVPVEIKKDFFPERELRLEKLKEQVIGLQASLEVAFDVIVELKLEVMVLQLKPDDPELKKFSSQAFRESLTRRMIEAAATRRRKFEAKS